MGDTAREHEQELGVKANAERSRWVRGAAGCALALALALAIPQRAAADDPEPAPFSATAGRPRAQGITLSPADLAAPAEESGEPAEDPAAFTVSERDDGVEEVVVTGSRIQRDNFG